MTEHRIHIPSEQELANLARDIAPCLDAGDCALLSGDLGTGKTSFARAFIRQRCGAQTEVVSPTFLLVQEYADQQAVPIFHFDLYRIKQAEELWELGLDEMMEHGVVLVEWPEMIDYDWPENRLDIRLEIAANADTARSLIVRAHGDMVGKLGDLLQCWQEKQRI